MPDARRSRPGKHATAKQTTHCGTRQTSSRTLTSDLNDVTRSTGLTGAALSYVPDMVLFGWL